MLISKGRYPGGIRTRNLPNRVRTLNHSTSEYGHANTRLELATSGHLIPDALPTIELIGTTLLALTKRFQRQKNTQVINSFYFRLFSVFAIMREITLTQSWTGRELNPLLPRNQIRTVAYEAAEFAVHVSPHFNALPNVSRRKQIVKSGGVSSIKL